MRRLTVWLLRHGQSTVNAGEPATAGVALTPLGRKQAQQAASRILRVPDLLVVSPLQRATETADVIQRGWPDAKRQVWAIGEFTYLSPQRCAGTVAQERSGWIASYWERSDPHHTDGDDAESFATFAGRVRSFRERVERLDAHFVVAVGHGQFFRAFGQEMAGKLEPTPAGMKAFRAAETRQPMGNGEIVEVMFPVIARTGE